MNSRGKAAKKTKQRRKKIKKLKNRFKKKCQKS